MTRSHHDMGGRPAGRIDRTEHDPATWEKRVDAMSVLLGGGCSPLFRIDERRRVIESLSPERYDGLGYYERWLYALATLLVEKGVVSHDELDKRVGAVKARAGAAS